MPRIRFHTFNGVRYAVDVDEPFVGICDPVNALPAIRLPKGLPYGDSKAAKLGLWTLLHECLHAEVWNMPEERVDGISKDIHELLWKLGYRRVRRCTR
jgi:hypothetical protein